MNEYSESFSSRMDCRVYFSSAQVSYSRREHLHSSISRGQLVSQKPSTMLVSLWAFTPTRPARMASLQHPLQLPISQNDADRPGFKGSESLVSVLAGLVTRAIRSRYVLGDPRSKARQANSLSIEKMASCVTEFRICAIQ